MTSCSCGTWSVGSAQGGLGREELASARTSRAWARARRTRGARCRAPRRCSRRSAPARRGRCARAAAGDLAAAGAVGGVGEAGVVLAQVHLHLSVGVGRHGRVELSFLEHRAHLLVSVVASWAWTSHGFHGTRSDGTDARRGGQRAHSFVHPAIAKHWSTCPKGRRAARRPPPTRRRTVAVATRWARRTRPSTGIPGAGGCRARPPRVGWGPDTQRGGAPP